MPMSDPEAIYHWHRLDERLTSSGQPTEAQLEGLAARTDLDRVWTPDGAWADFAGR